MVLIQEEAAQKENRFLTGRQIAWMIYQFSRSATVIDESLKVELKNDNVQSFKTRLDATIIAMRKQPDEENLENS